MKKNYIGLYFEVTPLVPATEILIAELGSRGFESFFETPTGLEAFIEEEQWQDNLLEDVYVLNSEEFQISYTQKYIESENWNEQWEKNFEPIVVDDRCRVRATFHEQKDEPFDIVITPKMSFGTGHHQTTFMMIQLLLNTDFSEIATVLDMGCGTGILAILAQKLGAKHIDAIDIDHWSYENAQENLQLNNSSGIVVTIGDQSAINRDQKYNLILANINRNLLLQDMETYVNQLHLNGQLFLSGFMTDDLEIITSKASELGLTPLKTLLKENWHAMSFIKKQLK